ncbi:Similar to hypothetical protein [Tuber melanosporum Mel28]; acc. no. XP_002835392 [Pyronema omphalodes CBS 100304]|uniref:Uncharacterized protein n=1 Tax=Pyronema omphalodes (strain CBS 100304) TaxID=1076935 RepID=U4KY54_PYROM|nr:Similar to hypothetical protein [Tuber melanosporum Mel28]; acc. no. XP_002835392 [Pyronema omphalodes CBS 100304]
MHARFVPTKHRFRYPLFYVGFPLTQKGSVGNGSFLSIKPSISEIQQAKENGYKIKEWKTAFTVDPSKYLNPSLPFDEKLASILVRHNLNPSDYPHAYLITTPSFLGFCFNPVSYYYLYDRSYTLSAVILEVNNTFGEKHVYFLNATADTNIRPRRGYTFAGTMEKVFHISCFNHRSGSYLVQVKDPLENPKNPQVDMHLTVITAEGVKSMVARAFSVSDSFDILSGGSFRGWKIAAQWGWVNIAALVRTFWEAYKLHKKKTVVYVRPEPLEGSRKREATRSEREMQQLWLAYLKARVMAYPRALEVKVGLPEADPKKTPKEVVFRNGKKVAAGQEMKMLSLRVLNPRFFLRFFANQEVNQTLWLDCTLCSEEHRPVVMEEGTIRELRRLLEGPTTTSPASWTWKAIAKLRSWKTRKEVEASRHLTKTSVPKVHEDEHVNGMDAFYLSGTNACPKARKMYQWKVLYAVVTDVVGFGDAKNVEVYKEILKAGGVTLVASGVVALGWWLL